MGAIRDFLDSVGRTKTGYAGTNIPGPPPVAPPDLTPTQITDALRDVLKKNIGFGGGDGTFSSTGTSKAGSAQTDAEKYAADKAAFDETVRKYQLDRKAYEQYQTDVNARLRGFNPYADAQYRIMPTNTGYPSQPTIMGQPNVLTTPNTAAQSSGKISDLLRRGDSGYDPLEAGRKQVEDEKAFWRKARPDLFGNIQGTVTVPTPTAPAAPTKLNAPTYGAIPITMSTPTDQGAAYKQMRDFGYTDADIRSATSKITGTPTDPKWADILSAGYSQYAPAVQGAYQQLGRSGFGGGAEQIDTPGYSYWLNQLSSGALRPEDLNQAVLTAGRPSNLSEIQNIYQQYFNRTPDPSGTQYWGQSGLTGSALQNAIIAGAQGPDLAYYQQNFGGGTQQPINQPTGPEPDPYYGGGPGPGGGAARGGYISKYAEGGRVRTHYQTGGMADEGNLDELDAFYRDPRNFTRPTPLGPARTYQEMMRAAMPTVGPVRGLPIPGETIAIGEGGTLQPMGGEPSMPMVAGAPAVEPTPAEAVGDPIQAAAAPVAPRQPSIQDLLARYGGGSGEGSRELAGARQRYQSEANAFSDMIRQMSERAESPTSRAEMYFRLAAAFGSPTRTGSMGETLGKVGEQMGEYTKGRRAEEAERRGLTLRAQEARLAGAREDLQTTRALAAQEGSERRAITSQLLQQYIRSGEPQSNAGRMARDMGLTPGTPAFNEFVQRNSELNIERTNQMMQAQAEILRLRTEAADRLSPTEIKMAEETMQNVAVGRDNLSALRRALELNESSSPDNLTQGTITRLRAALGSEAPIVVNTRELNNILDRLTLSSLKETFPGAISNDERTALRAVQGIGAKSLEERRRIISNAIENLERVIPRNESHFRNVRSGSFGRIER